MRVEKPKKIRTTFKLIPRQLHANFKAMVGQRGTNMQQKLRELIVEFCDKYEKDGFYAWGNNERFPAGFSKKKKVESMYAKMILNIDPVLLQRFDLFSDREAIKKKHKKSKSLMVRRLIDKWCRINRDSKVRYVTHLKKGKVVVKETTVVGKDDQ